MEKKRKGYEVFQPFLDGHEKEIEEVNEFVTEVRDLRDFGRKVVKAKISKLPEKLPHGEELWVKNAKEEIQTETWRIEIIEELDDETPVTRSEIEERKEFYGSPTSRYYAQKEMTKLKEKHKEQEK